MVERFLQAAAGDMQLQVLHERRRIHSVPTSEPTEARPLAFATISRRRTAYQNGVECRQRLWFGPTTAYSKRKSRQD